MKDIIVRFENTVDGSLQILTNLCLYCLGDVYVTKKTIECRFERWEDKEDFLREIDDLEMQPI